MRVEVVWHRAATPATPLEPPCSSLERAMKVLYVYRCRSGGLLLSAISMQHPLHGATSSGLVGVGVIDAADLRSDVGRDVERQLAARLFALLPDGILHEGKSASTTRAVEKGLR
jgi:hypothetical protein